jgi:hypothetical protein
MSLIMVRVHTRATMTMVILGGGTFVKNALNRVTWCRTATLIDLALRRCYSTLTTYAS